MQEQQNVALIQKTFAAFGRGDMQTLLEAFSSNAEIYYPGPPTIPYVGSKKGHVEIQTYFETIGTHQSNHNIRIDQFVAQDNNVVAIGWYTGVVNSTGKTIDAPVIFTFEVQDGRISRHMLLTDTAALAASYSASAAAAG